jgi:hypothetical protein
LPLAGPAENQGMSCDGAKFKRQRLVWVIVAALMAAIGSAGAVALAVVQSLRKGLLMSIADLRAAALCAGLLMLAFTAPALADAPVSMGNAQDYSVLGNAVTNTGATAMSDDLGSTAALVGTPIVLGQIHIGSGADEAKASMNLAYGDAQLRESTGPVPANLGGSAFGPGVYNASGAMGFTAATTMTLTGDQDAVFIFQIGGALSIGAGAQVNLVGGARPCNVFWQVHGATTIGANSNFVGTLMASSDITVGADARVDGRVLSQGAITLASNAIRTACTPTVVVAGPAGPTGPAGSTGPAGLAGAAGVQGIQGIQGHAGPVGSAGTDGAPGSAGPTGLTGLAGLTGLGGLPGATGVTGPMGADGPAGPAGVAPAATTKTRLCVARSATRLRPRRGAWVRWAMVVRICSKPAMSATSVTRGLRKGATLTMTR